MATSINPLNAVRRSIVFGGIHCGIGWETTTGGVNPREGSPAGCPGASTANACAAATAGLGGAGDGVETAAGGAGAGAGVGGGAFAVALLRSRNPFATVLRSES